MPDLLNLAKPADLGDWPIYAGDPEAFRIELAGQTIPAAGRTYRAQVRDTKNDTGTTLLVDLTDLITVEDGETVGDVIVTLRLTAENTRDDLAGYPVSYFDVEQYVDDELTGTIGKGRITREGDATRPA